MYKNIEVLRHQGIDQAYPAGKKQGRRENLLRTYRIIGNWKTK